MDLVTLRQKFVELTGRYDLVEDTTDWADAGADFFINAGLKYLDRSETIKKTFARSFPQVTSGDWYAIFENCRAIKEVWCSNSAGERWKLEKKDFNVLRSAYADIPSNLDGGDPTYYSPVQTLRNASETAGQMTIDYFYSTETTEDYDHFTYNALIFMPPADATFRLEIVGMFDTPELSDDDDENFWSAVHPLALVMAGGRALEISYRNTQGAKDWERSILMELGGFGRDAVEEEVSEISEMEG